MSTSVSSVVNVSPVPGGRTVSSTNPADLSEVVGKVRAIIDTCDFFLTPDTTFRL